MPTTALSHLRVTRRNTMRKKIEALLLLRPYRGMPEAARSAKIELKKIFLYHLSHSDFALLLDHMTNETLEYR